MADFKDIIIQLRTENRLTSNTLHVEIADFFNVNIDYLYESTNVRKHIDLDNDKNTYHSIKDEQFLRMLHYFNLLNSIGKE